MRNPKDPNDPEGGKKKPPKAPDYCEVEPRRNEVGEVIWPAPAEAIEAAREFIRECAASGQKVLIAPDKDADGLSSGIIIYRTLMALGLDEENIDVHLVQKGHNIHDQDERQAMASTNPSFIIVLDQGSRAAPPIVDLPNTRCLIIDHHLSDDFPADATVVSACHYPPVATSSLLTYEICKPLHPSIPASCDYLACIGTHGDLGNTLKWQPPFPDMTPTLKLHTKKAITDAIPLLNAPRRTPRYDVRSAWDALLACTGPKDLQANARLILARSEINQAVKRHTHTPPKFSRDGRMAVLQITSEAQVHPVIATRWAGYLSSKALEMVVCANDGYQEGMVNFSCRVARCATGREPPVDIIANLKEVVDRSGDEGLREWLGESFARGHREASGGIVPRGAFVQFMRLLGVEVLWAWGRSERERVGEGDVGTTVQKTPEKKKKTATIEKTPQKNTMLNYLRKRKRDEGTGTEAGEVKRDGKESTG